MSQENVDILRAGVAAWNRGDLDAFVKDFDPHVVIRLDPNWPENRPRFGADAARSLYDEITAMLGTGETVIEDAIDAGDRVVIRNRTRFRGRRSRIEDEVVHTQLVTLRRGKIVMIEWFLDHEEALRTAGLRA